MNAKKHWKALRAASLPLVPLFIYFLFQKGLFATDRETFMQAAGSPVTGVFLLVFIACAFYHAALGIEEIIVDYVDAPAKWLRLNTFIFAALGLVSAFAVISFMVHA